MKICILCQREFQDNKVVEYSLQDVAEAFKGNAIFETNETIVYLCEDCEKEYSKVISYKNSIQ